MFIKSRSLSLLVILTVIWSAGITAKAQTKRR